MRRFFLKKSGLLILGLLFLLAAGHYYTKHKTKQDLAIFLLRHSPLPSTFFGPPKGYVYAKHYKEKAPHHYHVIRPESEIAIAHFPYKAAQAEQILHFPEVFTLEIDKGRIARGIAITNDDRVLADTAVDWVSIKKHPIFRKWKLPKLKKKQTTIAIIASKGGERNYFHWMFDVVPKLEILKQSNLSYDKIYINCINQPYQLETIERLGLDLRKLMWGEEHLQAAKLVIPSLAGPCGVVPKWSCDFLRSTFLSTNAPYEKKKRIFISREFASTRRILNEKALFDALLPFGFEKVYLENLSIADQAALFASAELIVAPHGAGLTNLIFCDPGTKVIEIFNAQYLNSCFWMIGQQMHLEYHCLFFETDHKNKKFDMFVDIDKITQLVDNKSSTELTISESEILSTCSG